MAYDQSKDKLIKLFELKQDNNKSIQISIFSYNNGESKLQLHRSFQKVDGSFEYGKIGRMSLEEVKYLKDNIDDIVHLMENNSKTS